MLLRQIRAVRSLTWSWRVFSFFASKPIKSWRDRSVMAAQWAELTYLVGITGGWFVFFWLVSPGSLSNGKRAENDNGGEARSTYGVRNTIDTGFWETFLEFHVSSGISALKEWEITARLMGLSYELSRRLGRHSSGLFVHSVQFQNFFEASQVKSMRKKRGPEDFLALLKEE